MSCIETTVPAEVLVALGSNLGDPAALIRSAFGRLESMASSPVVASSVWNTTPVECPPGSPRFANAAARFSPLPGTTPLSLLRSLQALEREFGRKPKVILNESRPLDLDLIAWGSMRLDTPGLILPHPRAHLRRFVLVPLAEVAPEWVLAGHTVPIRDLLKRLVSDESVVRWD